MPGWWWHQRGGHGLVLSVGVEGGDVVGMAWTAVAADASAGLDVAAAVGVVVDSGVPCQLVGAGEAFRAAGKGAGVGLFARVGSYMPGLVFETVKGF